MRRSALSTEFSSRLCHTRTHTHRMITEDLALPTPILDSVLSAPESERRHRLLRAAIFQKPGLSAEAGACVRAPGAHGAQGWNEAEAMWNLAAEAKYELALDASQLVLRPCSELKLEWEWSCEGRRLQS